MLQDADAVDIEHRYIICYSAT